MEEGKVVAIQVAPTVQDKDNESINVVSGSHPHPEFYSVYTREACGTATFVEDYSVASYGPLAKTNALALAAELSAKHQAPVERLDLA